MLLYLGHSINAPTAAWVIVQRAAVTLSGMSHHHHPEKSVKEGHGRGSSIHHEKSVKGDGETTSRLDNLSQEDMDLYVNALSQHAKILLHRTLAVGFNVLMRFMLLLLSRRRGVVVD